MDIDINYTDRQPGAKLFEDILFGDKDFGQTEYPEAIRDSAATPGPMFASGITGLIRVATTYAADDERPRRMIIGLVPHFDGGQREEVVSVRQAPRSQSGT